MDCPRTRARHTVGVVTRTAHHPAPAGHVLVACDKFKGSLTATEVVAAIRAGVADAAPAVEVASVLVADGGDGTLAAMEREALSEA